MSGNVIPQPLLGQQYHLVLVVKNPDSVKHTYNIYVKQHSASPKVGAPGWPGWETAILGLPSEWQVNPRCTGASADFLGNLCGTKPQQVALEPSASTAITYTFTDWWDWIPPWDWTILAAEVLQVILLAHVGPLKALAFSGIEEGLGASYFILNEEFQFNLFSNRTMFESFPQGMGVPVSKIDAYTASFVLSLGAGGITTACLTGLACPPALISQAILIGMQYGTYKFAEDADSNYTTVVVPRPLTLNNGTALMNLPAVSLAPDRWKTLIETLAEAASFHNATMISAERYFGALEVGSQSFADLQLEAVAKYSTARDEALAVFDTQFSSLAYQIPALNSTIVQLSHDYLTRNGLPPVERQILSGLGLSESIDALSAGLMAFNTTTLNVVSLPDSIHLLRQTFVSQTNSWDNQAALSGEGISVSSFYTDGNGNQVNDDAQGNPKVDVVIANDLVRSTNPGQILAWVNLTNSAEGQYQSISINETLPLDWSISPPLASAHGSTKVYFANTTSLSSNLEITEPTTITVSTDNPEMIRLSIPSLNATAIGHPLMAGQTILLSVKMDYVLTGTTQLPKSYARYYSDIANAAVWTQTSYSGSKAMAIGSAFFKAYAKIQGESVPPLTILGLQPIVFYVIVGIAVVAAGAASVVVLRREDLLRSCRHKRILASREGPVGPQ